MEKDQLCNSWMKSSIRPVHIREVHIHGIRNTLSEESTTILISNNYIPVDEQRQTLPAITLMT